MHLLSPIITRVPIRPIISHPVPVLPNRQVAKTTKAPLGLSGAEPPSNSSLLTTHSIGRGSGTVGWDSLQLQDAISNDLGPNNAAG